jgi:hypothetical protein
MPHYSSDRCSGCGNITSPELLTIKRATFSPRLKSTKTVRSRVVAWLCEGCLDKDEDYNREAYSSTGMKSEPLERARKGEVT